jgi:SAM-dependent methyltransferase
MTKKTNSGRLTVVLDESNPHLGGNSVENNPNTFSPDSWKYIIDKYKIESVLDVGSGYGHAASWFHEYGLKTYAIDGLEVNCQNAKHLTKCVDLSKKHFVVDVDMVHCIEVVEHVDEKYIDNLLTTLCCGKYIFMTHGLPKQRGHHHVNNQLPEYWINHFKDRGYVHIEEDSLKIRELSGTGKHIRESGMVFVKGLKNGI